MSNCNPKNQQLYNTVFQFLLTSQKSNSASVASHVLDTFSCDEDENEDAYNQLFSKTQKLFTSQFRTTTFSNINVLSLTNAINETFGDPCKVTKQELIKAIFKVYNKLDSESDNDKVNEFINENITFESTRDSNSDREGEDDDRDWYEM